LATAIVVIIAVDTLIGEIGRRIRGLNASAGWTLQ